MEITKLKIAAEAVDLVDAVALVQEEAGRLYQELYPKSEFASSRSSAEIVLRNPVNYYENIRQLPDHLQEEWEALDRVCEAVAAVNNQGPKHQWSAWTTGVAKIQYLVLGREIDARWAGAVGDIIRVSSDLFAASSRIYPGNTPYFAEKASVAYRDAYFSTFRERPPEVTSLPGTRSIGSEYEMA